MASLQGKIIRYAVLPGIVPRLYAFFADGFGFIPLLLAQIYLGVGLLPASHPYFDPKNAGRFGIRHVIAEAANNLVFSKKHIDQILVFFIILVAAVLLFMQLILFMIALLVYQPVAAAPPPFTFSNMFMTGTSPINPGPLQDLSFILMDTIFGLGGGAAGSPGNIFGSCISTAALDCRDSNNNIIPGYGLAPYPTPFHTALHALLRFYSLGIYTLATFIIIYYIIAIAVETAASGTPFGQRFNRAWAPIRLIFFLALLTPLNTGGVNTGAGTGTNAGLNGAQILTFWIAKAGSNFATNGWGFFNSRLGLATTYTGNTANLIATPNTPNIYDLVKFMYIVKACQVAENYAYGDQYTPDGVQAYLVREALTTKVSPGPDAVLLSGTSFATARDFSNYGNIFIRFGVLKNPEYDRYRAFVRPLCGEIKVSVTDLDTTAGPATASTALQEMYYNMIVNLWTDGDLADFAECIRAQVSQAGHDPTCAASGGTASVSSTTLSNKVTSYQTTLDTDLTNALATANQDWTVRPEIVNKGWAGAAIWYNKLAEYNGDVASAVFALPEPVHYPFIMELVAEKKRMNNESVDTDTIYNPVTADSHRIEFPRNDDETIAEILSRTYSMWTASDSFSDHFTEESNGIVIDTINTIYGTSGLFSMRRNPNVHPLAQLSLLGKGMMEACLRNFVGGMMFNMGAGLAGSVNSITSATMAAIGDFMVTVGKSTMVISFILYYVLPFMPFIYFMFAVAGWVKAIFEAIVAMPLWALAHLRIDGNGLTGPLALNGYFLLLEIFLRPILTVFGLIASIQIFAALVSVMNQVFDLVTANLSGYDVRSELGGIGPSLLAFVHPPVDRFFFTALYAIMCYMTGLGCFRLIDTIPASILRWIGMNVPTFQHAAGDSAGSVLSRTYQGATLASGQIDSGGRLAALMATRG